MTISTLKSKSFFSKIDCFIDKMLKIANYKIINLKLINSNDEIGDFITEITGLIDEVYTVRIQHFIYFSLRIF